MTGTAALLLLMLWTALRLQGLHHNPSTPHSATDTPSLPPTLLPPHHTQRLIIKRTGRRLQRHTAAEAPVGGTSGGGEGGGCPWYLCCYPVPHGDRLQGAAGGVRCGVVWVLWVGWWVTPWKYRVLLCQTYVCNTPSPCTNPTTFI